MNKSFDYVIVGAGLSGCVVANRLASKGKKILILEKRNHIGGNVYDEIDSKTNIIVQKYGPHIFHTNNETVWNYVKGLCEWIPFEMKCARADGSGFSPELSGKPMGLPIRSLFPANSPVSPLYLNMVPL